MAVLLPVTRAAVPQSLVLVTRRGRIKRMPWSAFRSINKNGKKAIALWHGDAVVQAVLTDGTSDLLLVTRQGKALRLDETKIRRQGPTASGVRGMRLSGDDEILGCVAVRRDESLLLLHTKGKGKRVDMHKIRVKGRGGQGVWIVPHRKLAAMGPVAAVTAVSAEAEVAVLSAQGMVVRIPAASLPVISPAAAGVKAMRLENDDEVVGTTALPPSLAAAASEVPPL